MSKIVGAYQLREKIGKGSFADVYKAIHKLTGERFAIKTISKDILLEPKLLVGLESEIQIMKDFVHENIVRLYENFSSEKNIYLVLELCLGGDLSKFIKRRVRLDERLSISFLAQLTSGLAFLQEKNFIHRDLKPANVLLSEASDNAILKLADFGFARQLSEASLAQTRCGTPLYMVISLFSIIETVILLILSLYRLLKFWRLKTMTEKLMFGAWVASFMKCLSGLVHLKAPMKQIC